MHINNIDQLKQQLIQEIENICIKQIKPSQEEDKGLDYQFLNNKINEQKINDNLEFEITPNPNDKYSLDIHVKINKDYFNHLIRTDNLFQFAEQHNIPLTIGYDDDGLLALLQDPTREQYLTLLDYIRDNDLVYDFDQYSNLIIIPL